MQKCTTTKKLRLINNSLKSYADTARPIKGKDQWDEKGIGEGYVARGYMTSSSKTPFLIYLKKSK